MARIKKYIISLCCILLFQATRAQEPVQDSVEEAPTIEESSTVVTPPESYDSETSSEYYGKKEFGYYDGVPKFGDRKLNKDVVSKVRNDDAYWYANTYPEPRKEEKKKEIVVENTGWLNPLTWIILIGAFVALLVWLLSTSNISLFRGSPDEIETIEETHHENIFELDFEKEIRDAVASENYRLAVRLMYLQALRLMADRGIIRYAAEKTNSDYLFELTSTRFYKDFSRLTRIFDFIWYGKFPLSQDSFNQLQKEFSSFKQTVR